MADISKYSVMDPRIVQQKPKYAVEKGAVSITNQTFSAIANSSSQQTFQIQVPSENVFVDRALDWVNETNAVVTFTYTSAQTVPAASAVLVAPGLNFSLAPFPVTQSVSTMQATINDQSLSINMSDVLPQILRLADLSKTRKQRTCPTMLDRYYDVQSTARYPNSPVGSYGAAFSNDEVPCGAWGDLSFYVPTTAGSVGPITVDPATGLPLGPAVPVTTADVLTLRVGVRWQTAEKLVLPPFIFADEDELSTGLFGVQNMQFTMNFNSPARSFRMSADAGGGTLSFPPVVAWDSTQGAGTPFTKALVQVQFLTPSLDVNLPAKSICPWFEFPRYISPVQNVGAGLVSNIQSQTITCPMIPDLLIIFVKPQTYTSVAGVPDPTQADWSLPITNISLSFDNFSGLLSNHSQYELYKMSVNNGLEMDWDEWSGYAWGNNSRVPLVGGPLVLRPGRDFSLSTGQAPGLIGNFTLQFTLTIENATGDTYGPAGTSSYGSGVSIYTVTANSGFFETIRGSSRILRGVVTEQDILSAPVSEPVQSMERMVGEGKHHKHLGHGGARHHKKGMHAYVR
jgi:hypothetical protein